MAVYRFLAAMLVACAWFAPCGSVLAQGALERLESKLKKVAPAAPVPPPPLPAGKTETTPTGRPYLGIVVDDTADRGRGIRVLEVTEGGPGAQAGIKPQDLITAIDGQRVRQLSELSDLMSVWQPGQTVQLEIFRDTRVQKVPLVIGAAAEKAPPAKPAEAPAPPPDDRARIAALERKILELEQRIEALERALMK